jgi:hypothetical protein
MTPAAASRAQAALAARRPAMALDQALAELAHG